MLPIEIFAEAAAFLRLYDLNALAVTSVMCSSLAVRASNRIRREEFPGLRFEIANEGIGVYRIRREDFGEFIVWLSFPSEDDVIGFIAAAFPNCVFEDVGISCFASDRLLDAIGRVADSVVVKGVLRWSFNISFECRMDFGLDMLHPIQKFRKLKTLDLTTSISDGELEEIANFCRGHGIQELLYLGHNHRTEKKLTFF